MARPKKRKALTVKELESAIRKAVAEGKPRASAGDNLYVEIRGGEAALWHFRYAFAGKQNTISFGDHRYVSYAEASALARQANGMLAKRPPEDPRPLGKNGKREPVLPPPPVVHSFESVAREWFGQREGSRDGRVEGKWLRAFEAKLFPRIGAMDVRALTDDRELFSKALSAVQPAYTRTRMVPKVDSILKLARSRGWVDQNPTAEIRETLGPAPAVTHHKALEIRDVPDFLDKIERSSGLPVVKLALSFLMLTGLRSTEVRFSRWREIEDMDGPEPLWRIPAVRFAGKHGMKARRPHMVPLSGQAVAVLREAKALYPKSEIIFPSPRSNSGYLSENAFRELIDRVGYDGEATSHGMRTLCRDVLSLNKAFQSDWIEAHLSHLERDEVKAAYLRNAWMDHRREMMDYWGNWLEVQRRKGPASQGLKSQE